MRQSCARPCVCVFHAWVLLFVGVPGAESSRVGAGSQVRIREEAHMMPGHKETNEQVIVQGGLKEQLGKKAADKAASELSSAALLTLSTNSSEDYSALVTWIQNICPAFIPKGSVHFLLNMNRIKAAAVGMRNLANPAMLMETSLVTLTNIFAPVKEDLSDAGRPVWMDEYLRFKKHGATASIDAWLNVVHAFTANSSMFQWNSTRRAAGRRTAIAYFMDEYAYVLDLLARLADLMDGYVLVTEADGVSSGAITGVSLALARQMLDIGGALRHVGSKVPLPNFAALQGEVDGFTAANLPPDANGYPMMLDKQVRHISSLVQLLGTDLPNYNKFDQTCRELVGILKY